MNAAYFRMLFSVIFVSTIIMACGSDKNGNSNAAPMQCDAYGNCYPSNPIAYPPGTYPPGGVYPPYNSLSKTTVVLSGKLNITNPGAWKKALDGMQNCKQNYVFFTVSTCGWASGGNPIMEVVIYDYLFSQNNYSEGTTSFVNQNFNTTMVPQSYTTRWGKITSPVVGFQSTVTTPFTYYGSGAQMVITVQGRSTDSQVTAGVSYGGTNIGYATLLRINR